MTDIHAMARALGGEVHGNSVKFPTPGHSPKDRGSTLTLDEKAPDGFLLNSFNGADGNALRDYVRQKLGSPPKQKGSTRFVAEYIYRTAEGEPSRKVCRTKDKGFPQFKWTGSKWESGTKGVPLLPYRLPELVKASPETPVFICEGEKDCDRLGGLGFVATTNPMGAGKWSKALNSWFAGRRVFVIPDNDEPGRKHAAGVIRHLKPVAASVRIVDLPGIVNKGGDVSDWLDLDPGNKHRLLEVATAARAPRGDSKGVGLEDCVALEFAEQYAGELRYIAKSSQWMRWSAECWRPEDTLAAFDASRALCRRAGDSRAKTVAAVVTLARSDRRMAATVDQWDAQFMLLNARARP